MADRMAQCGRSAAFRRNDQLEACDLMQSLKLTAVAAFVVLAAGAPAAIADDMTHEHATAQEAVAKVRAAVALLEKKGEAGLKEFHGTSPFVWKDSYVFVSNCDTGIIMANPLQPDRQGKPIADGPTYGGVTAAQRAEEQCATARKPGGGWWAYTFAHPGTSKPTRKVSYMTMVPGHPWLVGAGVYDDTTPLEKFEAVSRATH